MNIDGLTATYTADPRAGELLYISHFATCPDRDHFRRQRQEAP